MNFNNSWGGRNSRGRSGTHGRYNGRSRGRGGSRGGQQNNQRISIPWINQQSNFNQFGSNRHTQFRPQRGRQFRSPPRIPQRPLSPLPGSEEYTQRNIQQASELIKRQLNIDSDDNEVINTSGINIQKPDVVDRSAEHFIIANTNPENPHIITDNMELQTRKTSKSKMKTKQSIDVQEIHEKILKHISKLSHSKKMNVVNEGSAGYDLAIHQLQKQQRIELSRALREMSNRPTQDSADCEVINSIIPDIGIKIEDLPREVIAQLSSTLNVDFDFQKNLNQQTPFTLVDPEACFKQAQDLLSDDVFPNFDNFRNQIDDSEQESMYCNIDNPFDFEYLNKPTEVNQLSSENTNFTSQHISPTTSPVLVDNDVPVLASDSVICDSRPLSVSPPISENLSKFKIESGRFKGEGLRNSDTEQEDASFFKINFRSSYLPVLNKTPVSPDHDIQKTDEVIFPIIKIRTDLSSAPIDRNIEKSNKLISPQNDVGNQSDLTDIEYSSNSNIHSQSIKTQKIKLHRKRQPLPLLIDPVPVQHAEQDQKEVYKNYVIEQEALVETMETAPSPPQEESMQIPELQPLFSEENIENEYLEFVHEIGPSNDVIEMNENARIVMRNKTPPPNLIQEYENDSILESTQTRTRYKHRNERNKQSIDRNDFDTSSNHSRKSSEGRMSDDNRDGRILDKKHCEDKRGYDRDKCDQTNWERNENRLDKYHTNSNFSDNRNSTNSRFERHSDERNVFDDSLDTERYNSDNKKAFKNKFDQRRAESSRYDRHSAENNLTDMQKSDKMVSGIKSAENKIGEMLISDYTNIDSKLSKETRKVHDDRKRKRNNASNSRFDFRGNNENRQGERGKKNDDSSLDSCQIGTTYALKETVAKADIARDPSIPFKIPKLNKKDGSDKLSTVLPSKIALEIDNDLKVDMVEKNKEVIDKTEEKINLSLSQQKITKKVDIKNTKKVAKTEPPKKQETKKIVETNKNKQSSKEKAAKIHINKTATVSNMEDALKVITVQDINLKKEGQENKNLDEMKEPDKSTIKKNPESRQWKSPGEKKQLPLHSTPIPYELPDDEALDYELSITTSGSIQNSLLLESEISDLNEQMAKESAPKPLLEHMEEFNKLMQNVAKEDTIVRDEIEKRRRRTSKSQDRIDVDENKEETLRRRSRSEEKSIMFEHSPSKNKERLLSSQVDENLVMDVDKVVDGNIVKQVTTKIDTENLNKICDLNPKTSSDIDPTSKSDEKPNLLVGKHVLDACGKEAIPTKKRESNPKKEISHKKEELSGKKVASTSKKDVNSKVVIDISDKKHSSKNENKSKIEGGTDSKGEAHHIKNEEHSKSKKEEDLKNKKLGDYKTNKDETNKPKKEDAKVKSKKDIQSTHKPSIQEINLKSNSEDTSEKIIEVDKSLNLNKDEKLKLDAVKIKVPSIKKTNEKKSKNNPVVTTKKTEKSVKASNLNPDKEVEPTFVNSSLDIKHIEKNNPDTSTHISENNKELLKNYDIHKTVKIIIVNKIEDSEKFKKMKIQSELMKSTQHVELEDMKKKKKKSKCTDPILTNIDERKNIVDQATVVETVRHKSQESNDENIGKTNKNMKVTSGLDIDDITKSSESIINEKIADKDIRQEIGDQYIIDVVETENTTETIEDKQVEINDSMVINIDEPISNRDSEILHENNSQPKSNLVVHEVQIHTETAVYPVSELVHETANEPNTEINNAVRRGRSKKGSTSTNENTVEQITVDIENILPETPRKRKGRSMDSPTTPSSKKIKTERRHTRDDIHELETKIDINETQVLKIEQQLPICINNIDQEIQTEPVIIVKCLERHPDRACLKTHRRSVLKNIREIDKEIERLSNLRISLYDELYPQSDEDHIEQDHSLVSVLHSVDESMDTAGQQVDHDKQTKKVLTKRSRKRKRQKSIPAINKNVAIKKSAPIVLNLASLNKKIDTDIESDKESEISGISITRRVRAKTSGKNNKIEPSISSTVDQTIDDVIRRFSGNIVDVGCPSSSDAEKSSPEKQTKHKTRARGSPLNVSDIEEKSCNKNILDGTRRLSIKLIRYDVKDLQVMKEKLRTPDTSFNTSTNSSNSVTTSIVEEKGDTMEVSNILEKTEQTGDQLPLPIEFQGTSDIVFKNWTGSILIIKVIESTVLAGNDKGIFYFYDLTTGDQKHSISLCQKPITSICINQNEDKTKVILYIGCLDGNLYLVDYETKEVISTINVEDPIQCMESSWGYIFMGSLTGNLIRYNIKKEKTEERVSISTSNVLVLRATQDGSRRVLLVATRNSPVTVRDAMDGLLMRTMEGTLNPTVYTLLFHKSHVYCGTRQHDVLVYTFQDGQLMFKHEQSNTSGVVCMNIVKNLLFVGCYNGNIYVYNTNTNAFIGSMAGPGGLFLSMEVSGDKMIVGTKQNHFKAWTLPENVLEHMV